MAIEPAEPREAAGWLRSHGVTLAAASVLAFRFGENWTEVALPAGTHTAYIPVTGPGDKVSVRLAQPGPALCITGMKVGTLEPGRASQ